MIESQEQRLPCLFCAQTYLNPDTIVAHCARDHDPSLNTVDAIYGHICPVCGQSFTRLGNHAGKGHRRTLPLLFAEAERDGDRHRVVWERRRIGALVIGKGAREAAIQLLVEQAPLLTSDQLDRLRVVLRTSRPPVGSHFGAADFD